MPRWPTLLPILITVLIAAAASAQPPAGAARQWWAGHVETPGPSGPVRLPVVITLAPDDAGAWHASFDVAPGAAGMGLLAAECTGVSVTPGALSLTLPLSPPMALRVERSPADGDEATGELRGDGMPPLPAVLRRVTEAEAATVVPARPQTPRPPLPYERIEVRVPTQGGIELAGTLTMPGGDGPHPAVLLVSGGGQQDRDHQVGFHRPFLVLADHLTRAGVATLRLDDRGVAPSGGVPLDATPEHLAADVRAAIALLRGSEGVDPSRIGVLALGEGTVPAAMAAAEDPAIAWLALIAPQGLPGGEVIALREQRRMEAEGEDPEYIAAQTEATRRLMALLAGSGNHEQIQGAIREAMLTGIRSYRGEGVPPEEWQLEETVSAQLHEYTAPASRGWIAADPRESLRRLRIPVLLIAGELDRVMPVGDTLPAAEAAVHEAGVEVSVQRMAGLNHLLQPALTGFADEIATIRTTIDPAALDVITDWILARGPRER